MRYRNIAAVATAALAIFSSAVLVATAQQSATPGRTFANSWPPVPRSQTQAQRKEAAEHAKGQPFNPRDLSGVWGIHGAGLNYSNAVPPMTPEGQKKYDAAKPGMGPRAVPLGNDPMMKCDPLGYPRSLSYSYGMEFVPLQGRVLQFFETYHTYRTIWTDGRVLPTPEDDAEPRWLGYSVGRWDGDAFVVESTGFDGRSWLDTQGHQHSDAMKLEERYRRTGYDTLQVTLTIDDPKTYTKPWVSNGTLRLASGTEIGEYFCVPSQEEEYRKLVREPAGGATKR
jgi:hypothetical protein